MGSHTEEMQHVIESMAETLEKNLPPVIAEILSVQLYDWKKLKISDEHEELAVIEYGRQLHRKLIRLLQKKEDEELDENAFDRKWTDLEEKARVHGIDLPLVNRLSHIQAEWDDPLISQSSFCLYKFDGHDVILHWGNKWPEPGSCLSVYGAETDFNSAKPNCHCGPEYHPYSKWVKSNGCPINMRHFRLAERDEIIAFLSTAKDIGSLPKF